jgi:hypothetical protein|tara:strand:- start:220 stop:414 length:195 start_codon:yes stop_codon:yes gene_type:complete
MSLDVALDHPWITRRLHEDLPLTVFEKHNNLGNEIEIEGKFRKALNIMMVCGMTGLPRREGGIF